MAFARSEGHVDDATADSLWETVRNSRNFQEALDEYPALDEYLQVGMESILEPQISEWCSNLKGRIQGLLPLRCTVT
jgi:hypothetical protein